MTALLANVHRRRGSRRFKPEEFIPDYTGVRRKARPKTQQALWSRINETMMLLGGVKND